MNRNTAGIDTPDMLIRLRNGSPDLALCGKLAKELNVPLMFSVLLWQRGITTSAEAMDFLHPRLADLPSPYLMKDMKKAVSLVVNAIDNNWPICIHGDYDVDGVSATALLALFFRNLHVRPICYQPDRLTEGYGLQSEFIRRHAPPAGENSLLITVDCGVSSVEEVKLARELGFTVIVTDHHEPPDILPEADALLNPKQPGCDFPTRELAGVGVAFYLAVGIRNFLVEEGALSRDQAPNLKSIMDLVALGTVADVMPVTGINRILVSAGIEIMNQQPNCWVSALQTCISYESSRFTAEDISYRFAPRINAPGRLGKPELAFELLTCADPVRALELARDIETINRERRELELQATDSVFLECEKQLNNGASGFVVQGDYHPGVIGIIASRVVDRYNKPVIIFTQDRADVTSLKGSGRSIESVNLFETLQLCKDTIIQFGGHTMAAGLTLLKENLPLFIDRFNFAIGEQSAKGTMDRVFMVDYIPTVEELLDDTFLLYYKQLEPFGNGNPEPVFLLENPSVQQVGTTRNHLKYKLPANGTVYHGIGFGLADKISLIQTESSRMAVKLKHATYRGVQRTEIHALALF